MQSYFLLLWGEGVYFCAYGTRQYMVSLPSFSQIWTIKRNRYSVEAKKKYKILCITMYVKSKQNGHEYSTFSESVVRVW